jgi:hypothetical protein
MGLIKRFNNSGKNNVYFVLLLIVVVLLTAFNVYLAYQYRRLIPYRDAYYTLENRTNILNSYYDELQGMHLELREEYIQISEEYQIILEEVSSIKSELEQIKNYEITLVLSENETLTISPGTNTTLTYVLPLSGYAVFNVSSSSDIYLWVGSSIYSDIYYSRHPAFPETATELNFTLPVSHTLYVFISTIDEIEDTDVSITIKYFY